MTNCTMSVIQISLKTTDKRDLAEELFQQLQENRYNLKGLQELEERINSL